MARQDDKARARALHHLERKRVKANRKWHDAQHRATLEDEAARGIRSHEGYCLLEGFMPAATHARLAERAKIGRGGR